jgi:hypothetical protein
MASNWSQPAKQLGLQVWATSTWFILFYF